MTMQCPVGGVRVPLKVLPQLKNRRAEDKRRKKKRQRGQEVKFLRYKVMLTLLVFFFSFYFVGLEPKVLSGKYPLCSPVC